MKCWRFWRTVCKHHRVKSVPKGCVACIEKCRSKGLGAFPNKRFATQNKQMEPSNGWCQIKRSAFASNLCSNLLAAFVMLIIVHLISFLQGHNTAKSIKRGKGSCNRNWDCISFYKKRDSPGGEDWLIHIMILKLYFREEIPLTNLVSCWASSIFASIST